MLLQFPIGKISSLFFFDNLQGVAYIERLELFSYEDFLQLNFNTLALSITK